MGEREKLSATRFVYFIRFVLVRTSNVLEITGESGSGGLKGDDEGEGGVQGEVNTRRHVRLSLARSVGRLTRERACLFCSSEKFQTNSPSFYPPRGESRSPTARCCEQAASQPAGRRFYRRAVSRPAEDEGFPAPEEIEDVYFVNSRDPRLA